MVLESCKSPVFGAYDLNGKGWSDWLWSHDMVFSFLFSQFSLNKTFLVLFIPSYMA